MSLRLSGIVARLVCLLILPWGACLAANEDLLNGESLPIDMGNKGYALLSLSEERLSVSGPAGPDVSIYFDQEMRRYIDRAVIAKDLNGDGWTDLMLLDSLIYGGLDLSYQILIFAPRRGWRPAGSIANPEILTDGNGLTSHGAAGVVSWFNYHYRIGPDGLPYIATAQRALGHHFMSREERSPDGEVLRRFLVAEGTPVVDPAEPAVMQIADTGTTIMPGGQMVLPSGTQVTVIDYDETTNWILVELSDGRRVFVDPEALVPPDHKE